MNLIYDIIMGFVAFSAVAVLFASLIALAIWLLVALPRRWSPMTLANHDHFARLTSMIGEFAKFTLACRICGRSFKAQRPDASTCSSRCRVLLVSEATANQFSDTFFAPIAEHVAAIPRNPDSRCDPWQ